MILPLLIKKAKEKQRNIQKTIPKLQLISNANALDNRVQGAVFVCPWLSAPV
jgi:hypothetical protein